MKSVLWNVLKICMLSIVEMQIDLWVTLFLVEDVWMVHLVNNLPAIAGNMFHPWVGMIPWRRKWQPSPGFLAGESREQRSLVVPRVAKSWTHLSMHTHSISQVVYLGNHFLDVLYRKLDFIFFIMIELCKLRVREIYFLL